MFFLTHHVFNITQGRGKALSADVELQPTGGPRDLNGDSHGAEAGPTLQFYSSTEKSRVQNGAKKLAPGAVHKAEVSD